MSDAVRSTVFVFSGQGSQGPGMGRALLATDPAFRAAIDRFDALLRARAGWSLHALLRAGAGDTRWDDVEHVQPALVAVQVALAALWQARGVRPDAVVGHSLGEVAAACVAGVLTEAEAVRVIVACSRGFRAGRSGRMLLAGVDAEAAAEAAERHPGAAFVSGRLSPHFTVLSGTRGALDAIAKRLRADGRLARPVRVDAAAHCPFLEPGAAGVRAALAGLAPRAAAVPFYSAVTGGRADGPALDAGHWARLIHAPVVLQAAVEAALDAGPAALVEVSPNAILTGMLEDTVEVHPTAAASIVLPTQVRGRDPEQTLRATRDRLGAPPAPGGAPHEPLAIVGMACRLPGGIDGPDALWDVLRAGREVITDVPADRWDADALFDPEPGAPGRMYVRRGGFLDAVDGFDAGFFRISPREAQAMDPQQRLLLETTWEALEHAGIAPDALDGARAGVFTGVAPSEHELLMLGGGGADPYAVAGTSNSVASGRVAYVLGLHGPAVSVDTACSSSLTALHLARQSLLAGETDVALVAGVNVMLAPTGLVARCQSRMMSPDGRCHSFDAAANGYVQSEGCGVLVVKRLADAERDGDRVLAVVRGTATNQDGRSAGMMAPSAEAQEAVVRAALADAGLAPDDVQYVETHGTGTPVGDPLELQALQAVFGAGRRAPLLLGTAKASLGHCESAAGVVGVIKAVLSLGRGEVTPHPHLATPTPAFDWSAGALALPTRPAPWPETDGPRRAGVSAFGISGTNVHVVLEAAPAPPDDPADAAAGPALLPLSAHTPEALAETAARHARRLDAVPDAAFGDVCGTAARGRAHFEHRLAVVAAGPAEAADALRRFASGDPSGVIRPDAPGEAPSTAFLFTGQGAQYPGMGRALYDREPAFRRALDRCADAADPLLEHPLRDVLFGDAEGLGALVHETAYTQPALFAVEYALAALWRAWGVAPAAVLGHSIGEYVAACVAGVFSVEDAVRLVVARGRLMGALPGDADRMAAVFGPEDVVRAALAPHGGAISVAAVNGPENVVVSGERAAVEAMCARLEADGLATQPLQVSHAFHSARMEPMLAAFERAAAEVTFSEPRLPLVSNVTGRVAAPGEVTTPAYWARHVREAVRFRDGMAALWSLGVRAFVEAGPHPVLLGMGRASVPAEPALWLPSLRRDEPHARALRASLAALYVRGATVDWAEAAPLRRRRTLPTYPFQHRRYPSGGEHAQAFVRHAAPAGRPGGHPLLGPPVTSPLVDGTLFEAAVRVDAPAYLGDHRIYDVPVFPGMGYLEVALAAARNALGDAPRAVERLTVLKALVLAGDAARTLHVALTPESDGRHAFRVFSRAAGEEGAGRAGWTEHAAGTLAPARADAAPRPGLADEAAALERLDPDDYYAAIRERGSDLQGAFLNLASLHRRSDRAMLGRVRLPGAAAAEAAAYGLHPALLDGCLQVLGAAIPEQEGDLRTHVPLGVGRFQAFRAGCTDVWCEAELASDGTGDHATGSFRVYDAEGRPVAALEDVELQRVRADAIRSLVRQPVGEWMYDVAWTPAPTDAAPAPVGGRWLVLADRGGVGAALAERLRAGGADAVLAFAGPDAEGPDADGAWTLDPARPDGLRRLLGAADGGPWAGLVHLWTLDAPAPEAGGDLVDVQRAPLGGLVQAARAAGAVPRLVLVTRGSVDAGAGHVGLALAGAPAWGLRRVLAAEHPELHAAAVDLPLDAAPAEAAALVADALGRADEPETAYREGARLAARLVRHAPGDAWPWSADAPYRLEVGTRGDLDALALVPAARRAPGPGEVEIAVEATGLNFRDVLNALGMYPGDAGLLGGECAGRVARVGASVTHVAPGDAVVALATGAFATFVTVPAPFVVPAPARATPTAAATLPITFLTAFHGLHRIAGLRPGQRVLVHAAAGGVGMAAVQLAVRAGAEVYGTAGTPAKRAAARALGALHVMDSRTLGFADEIRARTGGEGVDVVLNALTGDFIPAGLGLLRDGGYFLELGKRELWTRAQVDAVNPLVHYVPYDLGDVMRDEPEAIHEMLRAVVAAVDDGGLAPLPVTTFPVRAARDAFRYMAQARHTGKVVVLHPAAVAADAPLVQADATYLVTGGRGALGLRLAERLVARGARHLVLAGRSAPSAEAEAAAEALRAAGAAVHLLRADVADAAGVDALLAEIDAAGPPLRGVFHAAGVVDDALLGEQDAARIARVLAPKLAGAWHLHRATHGRALDHFVLFSSLAAVMGSAGQGVYAGANLFLDRLAAARRGAGLPALSVNWGPWDEVGMAARLDDRYRSEMRRAGLDLIPVEAGLDALERLLHEARAGSGPASVVVQPFAWGRLLGGAAPEQAPPLLRTLAAAAPAAAHAGAAPRADAGREALLAALDAAAPAERVRLAADDLRARIARVTGLAAAEVPTDRPLTTLGLESLMAVEFKSQVEAVYGVPVSVAMLLRGATLDEVARHAVDGRFGTVAAEGRRGTEPAGTEPTGGDGNAPAADPKALLARLDTLSEAEMDALLRTLDDPATPDDA